MSKKITSRLAWTLFSLLTAVPIYAQEVATLALRNGERPSGELIDMNGSSFVLRINGQERSFSIGDVSAVEFVVGAPPADAQNRINAGQPVVVLRSGQVIDGRLSDIGGTRPLRLTVDTPSGQRQFTSSDVAQIYVNPAAQSAAGQSAQASVGTAGTGGAVTVPANQPWTETGIVVRRGQPVQFAATGDIMISSNASSGIGGSPAATVPSIRYPVTGAPVGALIGRVGNGAPFLIGANTGPIPMPGTGRLLLGVNDDHTGDNTGTFAVTVTRLER